jgi:hypothetical protein
MTGGLLNALYILGLGKIDNECHYSCHNEIDAHQIIEDFGENKYYDAEDKADYSCNQT